MSLSVTHNRICQRGVLPSDIDVASLGPDIVALACNQPPSMTEGGLVVDGRQTTVPFKACVTFTVIGVSPQLGADARAMQDRVQLKPGDVILAVNAILDPLYGNQVGYGRLPLCYVDVVERAGPAA